jgi:DNA-binding transcriptional ArsR family regulator
MGTVLSYRIIPRRHLDAKVLVGVPTLPINKPSRLGGAVTRRTVDHRVKPVVPAFPSLFSQREALVYYYTLWCNMAVDQLTDVLIAISHPTRRAIIGQLANGPARFLEVAKPFDTALNAVTKHLKLLERAGLIQRRKQGREVYISFRGEPLQRVAGWVHEYERFWNERLDQFEQYFKDKRKTEKR